MKKVVCSLALAAAAVTMTACGSSEPDIDWQGRFSTVASMKSGAKSMEGFITPAKNIVCAEDRSNGSLMCMRINPSATPTGTDNLDFSCAKNPTDATIDTVVKVRRNSSSACWTNREGSSEPMSDEAMAVFDELTIDSRRGATLETENQEFVCGLIDDRSVMCVDPITEKGFFIDDHGFVFLSNGDVEAVR